MDKRISAALVILGSAVIGAATASDAQLLPATVACLHDGAELRTDRLRREQALALAREINGAQGTLAQQTRRYHRLAALPNLPDVPAGFELKLYGDDAGYVFSLKDTRDTCRYAIFSDQSGLLYEKAAHATPTLASD